MLPGSGLVFTGRRRTGFAVMAVWLALIVVGIWGATHPRSVLAVAVDSTKLVFVIVGCVALLLAWVALLVYTYLLVRPADLPRLHRVAGRAGVGVLCLIVVLPLAVTARYASIQRDLVNTVFPDAASATRPHVADTDDPWAHDERVNVLLLGGDGAVDREGIRTDTMIVASIDTSSGDTTLFSVPRNLMRVPFPKDSPLHDVYPNGFTGEGDNGEWMLNAVYRNVPKLHPHILGKSGNEGADALKLAISAALGIPVDYYVLVNLAGFEKVVNAIGGVTVNINKPIPVGGNTDLGIPPDDYLEPGPNQHLNGHDALWYSRGRYGLSDYDRMKRQRCMIKAIIDEADPVTLFRRYRQLAKASKKIVRTDIPQDLLPAFVDLAMKVKDAQFESVVFVHSEKFDPGDPDYDWMRNQVQKALADRSGSPQKGSHDDGGAGAGGSTGDQAQGGSESAQGSGSDEKKSPSNPCAYHPVG